jgi:hypothetical protein
VIDVERGLTQIGREIEYPPPPELAPAVGERVRRLRAPRRLPSRRILALAAAALLLLVCGAAAAVPASRHAVLDWLGLRSVHIERAPRLPVLPPGPAGGDLDLGTRTTLAGARGRAGFEVLVPPRPPNEVYFAGTPAGGRVSLVYAARSGRPRVLVTEFRGTQPRGFLFKTLGPGTTAEPVRVNGDAGVWIAGRPHQLVFMDANGHPQSDTVRLAGNTLLWQHGEVLLRLEARVSKAEALRIAQSTR